MAIAIEDKNSRWVDLESKAKDDFDLRSYTRVVMRSKWKIISFAIMTSIIAALVAYRMTPIYRSTATIMVESSPGKVLSIEEIYRNDARSSEYFGTQFEILKSRGLGRQVIEKLELEKRPEYVEALQEASTQKKLDWRSLIPFELPPNLIGAEEEGQDTPKPHVATLEDFGTLSVKPRRQTQLVDVSFDSYDPQLAKDVVNTLGEAYVQSNVAARLEATHRANSWLAERMDGLRHKLAQSEKRLQNFLESEKLIDIQGVYTISSREIEGTTEKIVEARSARAAAESVYNKINSLGDGLTENLDTVPEILDDPVIRELKAKEAEAIKKVSELNERYGPKHPSYIAAQSDLNSVKDVLRQQTNKLVEAVKHRYDVARANESSLTASLDKNKQQVQSIGRKQAQLEELRREVQSTKNLYDMFFTRFKETSEAGDLMTANARFIDDGELPEDPVKPNKKLIVLLAFVGSGFLATLLALAREQFHNTIRSPEELELKLGGIPLLGTAPKLKDSYENPALAYFDEKEPLYGESIRTIRTGIMLSTLDVPHKVLLVTSTLPNEGKTTVSYNLALSMRKTMRILLIDADLRRSSIGKLCGLPPRAPGLADILVGEGVFEQCVVHDEATGLHILPAGFTPNNALDLLASKAFTRLIEEIETKYDAILIDSPPIHAVSDAQLLAQYVTANIYVVEADRTPVRAIRSAMKRLDACRAPVAGIILNKYDSANAERYGYVDYQYDDRYLPSSEQRA